MPDLQSDCWIHADALSELCAEARRWRTRETGGALFGWREGRATVVARVVGPGPNARHGVRWFEPDTAWQVVQGRRIYAESGRTIAYLGDWHTHPFGAPRPSSQDAETAKLIARDARFRAPTPLYAILGRSVRSLASLRPWRLVIYEWHDGRFVSPRLHSLGETTAGEQRQRRAP
jgi:integrative and conjugative element protein (TIGR02256 family)